MFTSSYAVDFHITTFVVILCVTIVLILWYISTVAQNIPSDHPLESLIHLVCFLKTSKEVSST